MAISGMTSLRQRTALSYDYYDRLNKVREQYFRIPDTTVGRVSTDLNHFAGEICRIDCGDSSDMIRLTCIAIMNCTYPDDEMVTVFTSISEIISEWAFSSYTTQDDPKNIWASIIKMLQPFTAKSPSTIKNC
jgi:hypothetical protein